MMAANERPLLSNRCSIRPDTALHKAFVRWNLKTSQIPYREVRHGVLRLIVSQGLYHSSMVFCNQELENILAVKALYFRQIDAALLISLHLWDTPPVLDNHSLPIFTAAERMWLTKPNIRTEEAEATESKYLLGEGLRLLFTAAGVGDPSNRFITFPQAIRNLRNYIAKKRTSLVDSRNIDVVLIEHDPLGALFQVKGFHFTYGAQALLRKHLLPASELPPKKRIVPLAN